MVVVSLYNDYRIVIKQGKRSGLQVLTKHFIKGGFNNNYDLRLVLIHRQFVNKVYICAAASGSKIWGV